MEKWTYLAMTAMDYEDEAAAAAVAGFSTVWMLIILGICVLQIVASWRLFEKAGEPGWASIVPFYNTYVLFRITYGSGWKMFLLLVPFLNYVVEIAYLVRLAQVFGKGVGFRVLTVFFAPITMLIMAFGDASYEGPVDSFI